jgi:hypothetical protein
MTRVPTIAVGVVAATTLAAAGYLAAARHSRGGAGVVQSAEAPGRRAPERRSLPRLIAPDEAARVDSTADADARERSDRSFQHYFADLEAERTKAAPDPDWSPRAERLIRSFAESDRAAPGISINVACGPTLCRVELRTTEETARTQLARRFHRYVARELPTMTMHTAAGTQTSVMYLARSGNTLPAMALDDLQGMN